MFDEPLEQSKKDCDELRVIAVDSIDERQTEDKKNEESKNKPHGKLRKWAWGSFSASLVRTAV